jgi:hypothetical protein
LPVVKGGNADLYVKKIENIISGGIQPKDIAGVRAEIGGGEIWKPSGQPFDHIKEMQNNIVGLKAALARLENGMQLAQMRDPKTPADRDAAAFMKAEIVRAKAAIALLEGVLA